MEFHKRKEQFISEVKALGEKYQIGLVGSCESEGIYGEIMVVDLTDTKQSGWVDIDEVMWNFE